MSRPVGSRNRITAETLALVEDGKTPVAFCLAIMNDETKPDVERLHAARIAAPYLHPKPQPEGRWVKFALSDDVRSAAGLTEVHTNVLRAVSQGEMSLDEAKDISVLVETQRRIVETGEIEARLARLEAGQKQ